MNDVAVEMTDLALGDDNPPDASPWLLDSAKLVATVAQSAIASFALNPGADGAANLCRCS
jgi:hypothetical protein